MGELFKTVYLPDCHHAFLYVVFSFIFDVYFSFAYGVWEGKVCVRFQDTCLGIDSSGQRMSNHLNEKMKHVFTVVLTVSDYERYDLCQYTAQCLYCIVHSSSVTAPKKLEGCY